MPFVTSLELSQPPWSRCAFRGPGGSLTIADDLQTTFGGDQDTRDRKATRRQPPKRSKGETPGCYGWYPIRFSRFPTFLSIYIYMYIYIYIFEVAAIVAPELQCKPAENAESNPYTQHRWHCDSPIHLDIGNHSKPSTTKRFITESLIMQKHLKSERMCGHWGWTSQSYMRGADWVIQDWKATKPFPQPQPSFQVQYPQNKIYFSRGQWW